MIPIADLINPVVWGLAALGAAAALLSSDRSRHSARRWASTLLLLAGIGLLASVAVAAWLPTRSLVVRPDGSMDDPRLLSVLALAVATLIALAHALRDLRVPALGLLGLLLPGLGVAGLVAAVSSFLGLRSPTALTALVLAGFLVGAGLVVFSRLRGTGSGWLALQVAVTGLLLVTGVLSTHGARADALALREAAPVDTLGVRVELAQVAAPHDSLRRMEFILSSGGAPRRVWTELQGRVGSDNRSIAGGGLFDGPLVVPVSLQEYRPQPHDVVWLAKGDSLAAGGSVLRFVGFRILPGDTIRMLADLDVTTEGRTRRVSPGMYARAQGTTPFAAVAEGLGPISLARIDADNGRIALMLPTPSATGVQRVATASLQRRPALPAAWVAAALLVIVYLLGMVARSEDRPVRH